MFDTGLRLMMVAAVVIWVFWFVNMIGDILVPRIERAGPPPEIPLTPIYRVRD